jgi:hypothetical protein
MAAGRPRASAGCGAGAHSRGGAQQQGQGALDVVEIGLSAAAATVRRMPAHAPTAFTGTNEIWTAADYR